MNIFISHISALECLRANDSLPRSSLSRAKPISGNVPTADIVGALDLAALGVRQTPLHLVVADAASRGCSRRVKCHVWHGPAPSRSFVKLADGVYASSPEACFLQLATVLTFLQLVMIGYELCGSYAIDPDDPWGFRKRPPLTSVAAIGRYLEKSARLHGVKTAVRALRFVVDGSASPMETALVMLLCLPSAYGCYGLPFPALNYEVAMPGEVRRATGRARCFCDLYWRAARLAVEYESDLLHAGAENIGRDSMRRTALERAGVSTITVTWAQVRDARELDEVALALAKRLGVRMRRTRSDWLARRYEARSQILRF